MTTEAIEASSDFVSFASVYLSACSARCAVSDAGAVGIANGCSCRRFASSIHSASRICSGGGFGRETDVASTCSRVSKSKADVERGGFLRSDP